MALICRQAISRGGRVSLFIFPKELEMAAILVISEVTLLLGHHKQQNKRADGEQELLETFT